MASPDSNEAKLSPIYNVLVDLEREIHSIAYNYTTEDEFAKIGSVVEMQLVYWSEMIQRIHVCACTSMKRIKKWMESAHTAYKADNYYGFCAALRGLIESCADTFYAVSQTIEPICTNFASIDRALRGEATKVLLSEQIEHVLIHYMFARKLSKSEQNNFHPAHQAEQVRTYIESLGNSKVLELYSELCQVSHPSAISLLPFLLSTNSHQPVMHNDHVDRELNDTILSCHKTTLISACNMSVLPAMCMLQLINEFDAPITEPLRTSKVVLGPALESDFWINLSNIIAASRAEK